MPLYEYRCEGCEEVHEILQRISERPKRKCPDCGGRLEKLVSRSGFVLKGSGWYVTDYADKGRKSGKSSKSEGGGSDSSDDASSSETKSKSKSTGSGSKDAKSAAGG